MQQLDNLQSATGPYEAQIRARVLEGSFAPGTPADKSLMPDENGTRTFRGRLEVPGLTSLPIQNFSVPFTETGGYIENHPKSKWPVFKIDLVFHPDNEQLEIKGFNIASADNTVEAGLLYTRIAFALFTSGKFYLKGKIDGRDLEIMSDKLSLPEQTVLSQAKLFRKLKYIESIFDVKFHVPEEVSRADASQIEVLFRGITEGKFTVRSGAITFRDYTPLINELNGPPFTEPGPISYTFKPKIVICNSVFSHDQVGTVSVHLDRAVVANSRAVDKLRLGETVPQMRFVVFDHQIKYRFEKYAALSPQARRRKLEQFKRRLLKEEPQALVALLDEPFAPDVSADEVRRIVIGWLQYNMFPDRFWPQEPSLENHRWRVPVWVTAPRGQGGWVQDVFVDLKTGIVTTPISVEELKALGKSVAAETLRAS